MDHTEAQKWAEAFESKSVSELEALTPPSGMHSHIIKHWQRARLAAVEGKKAALNAARQTLAQQIAARAEQLQQPQEAAENSTEIAAREAPAAQSQAEKVEFNSFDRAENLREHIAVAIARNNAPVPEPMLTPLPSVILQRTPPLEAMEIQISSSASLVEGLARQFREQEFGTATTCEIMKSMAVLIAANAALGKVVYHFQNDAADASGRRSNAC